MATNNTFIDSALYGAATCIYFAPFDRVKILL
jgi:hypothetical protein